MRSQPQQPEPKATRDGGAEPLLGGEIAPELAAGIIEALARPPVVAIPADFAARVSREAHGQPRTAPQAWLGWGPRLSVASGAALLLALFAVAPHAAPSLRNGWFDAELAMLAELSALLLFSHRLLGRR